MKIKNACGYFWTEKKEDFVKFCFDFLPESDEYILNIKRIQTLIKEKIDLNKYSWFITDNNNKIIELEKCVDIFSTNSSVYFLLPVGGNVEIDNLNKIILRNNCNFEQAYKTFYYSNFVKVQKELQDAVIINYTVLLNKEEFISTPFKAPNVLIYSLDVYMKDVDKIKWE